MDRNIFLNCCRRLVGKEPINDMPRWIVFYGKPAGIAGEELFPSNDRTYGKIEPSRSYGLNKYGYTYTFLGLCGRRIPFWREDTSRKWAPLTRGIFDTEAEYEMFLMLHPQINREDLEKFE